MGATCPLHDRPLYLDPGGGVITTRASGPDPWNAGCPAGAAGCSGGFVDGIASSFCHENPSRFFNSDHRVSLNGSSEVPYTG